MTDYPYSGILKQAKNTDIIGRMSYPNQWPEDCRPITKRQYVLCLGTEVILKYTSPREPIDAGDSLVYFNMI